MRFSKILFFTLLALFLGSCEKEEVALSEIASTNTQIQSRNDDGITTQCIPDENVSIVGRSIAWHAYQQIVNDKPSIIIDGVPDFENSVSFNDGIESQGSTFTPIVDAQEFESSSLSETPAFLMVLHNSTGEQFSIYFNRAHLINNPFEEIDFIIPESISNSSISYTEILEIYDDFDWIYNCKAQEKLGNELPQRRKGPSSCPTWGSNIWCNIGSSLGGFFGGLWNGISSINLRPKGGRTDDDITPNTINTIIISGGGNWGPPIDNTNNPGSTSDPNYINNRDELFNCLGFDQFDDNTSPPHPNVELCSAWMNYYQNCLQDGENFGVPQYIQAVEDWARHMTLNSSTFQDVIEFTLVCVDEESFECVEYVSDIVDEYGLGWNDAEQRQFIADNLFRCGGNGTESEIESLIAEKIFNDLNETLNLDDNRTCLIGDLPNLSKIRNFVGSHAKGSIKDCDGEDSSSVENLENAIADAFADGYCEDPTNPIFNTAVPINENDPLFTILLDQLKSFAIATIADLIPGGSLLTTGPEFIEHVKAGNYMEALYSSIDIALNEAEHCFPAAKAAALLIGGVEHYKSVRRLIKAFDNMKHLGSEVVLKMYDVFTHSLGWDINKINNLFKLLENDAGNIGGSQNALLEGITGDEFFNKLKEIFADFTVSSYLDGDGNIRTVLKIGELPPNKAIYIELYPEANSGWPWTVEFSFGPINTPPNNENTTPAFKIRFKT